MFGMTLPILRWISHFLHFALVIIHIVFLKIHTTRAEQYWINTVLQEGSRLPTILSVSQQAFYTVYSTILVTLTQRLGLLRALHRRQSLTTLSDASSAWSGLGSALVSLWNNTHMPAGVVSSTIITAYLGCALVLHVVSSSIMSMAPTGYQTVQNVSAPIWVMRGWPVNLSKESAKYFDWTTLVGATFKHDGMPYLEVPGLDGTTVYDTVDTSEWAGTIQLNATTVDFKCGLVPSANMTLTTKASTENILFWNGYASNSSLSVPWINLVTYNEQMTSLINGSGVRPVIFVIDTHH